MGNAWNVREGSRAGGLFYGDARQFVAADRVSQLVAVGAMAYGAYKLTAPGRCGHRVSAEVKELGLDLPEWARWPIPTRTKSVRRR